MKTLIPLLIGVTALASVITTDVQAGSCGFTPTIGTAYISEHTDKYLPLKQVRQKRGKLGNKSHVKAIAFFHVEESDWATITKVTKGPSKCVSEYRLTLQEVTANYLPSDLNKACMDDNLQHENQHKNDRAKAFYTVANQYLSKLKYFARTTNVNSLSQAQYQAKLEQIVEKFEYELDADIRNEAKRLSDNYHKIEYSKQARPCN